jgi:hypothetical protein
MRCQQFDKETIHALQAMGFEVMGDNESAIMEATVSVIHPAREECLLISIELPCGGNLSCRFTPERIVQIAWRTNEEAMELSHE